MEGRSAGLNCKSCCLLLASKPSAGPFPPCPHSCVNEEPVAGHVDGATRGQRGGGRRVRAWASTGRRRREEGEKWGGGLKNENERGPHMAAAGNIAG